MKIYHLPYNDYALSEWLQVYEEAHYGNWNLTSEEWDDFWESFSDTPPTLVIDDSYFEDDETYFDDLD